MKKIAFACVALAGLASLAACRTPQQQTYRPAPAGTSPAYSGSTYTTPGRSQPYTQPSTTPQPSQPRPAPRAACGGGKCG